MAEASGFLAGGFIVLAVVVLLGFLAVLHVVWHSPARAGGEACAAIVALAWAALTAGLAAAGRLSFSPPTVLAVLLAGFVLSIAFALSRTGRKLATTLPLWLLVGFQAFRLPLELLMHRAYEEGVMPVQMSYSGLNFDIITGATALVLGIALAMRHVPLVWVRAWNALGVLLLLNVLSIALLSAPIPIRVFMNEPANVWITRFPFVWLPAILVQAAIIGHVLVIHRLRAERAVSTSQAQAGAQAQE
jgi:hypothetical protein